MNSAASDNQATTIYVGDIPSNITIEQIKEQFSQIDQNIEIDQTTNGPKLGSETYHCLIKFKDHAKAQKAIDEFNYAKFDGKTIRVSMKEDNKFDTDADLVISNLPVDVDEKTLHDNLNEYGEIISCKILRNREGQSRGMGYVQFRSKADADKARNDLHHAYIQDRLITVEIFRPKNQRQNIPKSLPPNVIAISSESMLPDNEILNKKFSQFGPIINIINIENHTLIFYENEADASKAIKEFKDTTISIKKQVQFDIAKKANEINDQCSIFISDLTIKDSDKGKFEERLRHYGKILSFLYEPNKRNPNLFISTVRYSTPEARNAALKDLDHSTFEGQYLPLHVQPFINKSTEHSEAGLVIFPSLPISIRYSEFYQEMSSYGSLITISLIPTLIGESIGFALFQNADDAKKAKEYHKNSLLFPRYNLLSLLPTLSTFNNDTACGVIVYNINDISKLNSFPDLSEINIIQGNVIIIFKNMEAAGKAFENICNVLHFEADIFYPQITDNISNLLNHTVLPAEYRNQYLFVRDVGSQITNQILFDSFSRIGQVEFAYQLILSEKGISVGRALVVMKKVNDALTAIEDPPTVPDGLIAVERYVNAAEKNGKIDNTQTNIINLDEKMLKTPRKYLTDLIIEDLKQEFPKVREDKVFTTVKKEPSNDEVISLIRHPNDRKKWIYDRKKNIRQT